MHPAIFHPDVGMGFAREELHGDKGIGKFLMKRVPLVVQRP
jgi:hypothetical protein